RDLTGVAEAERAEDAGGVLGDFGGVERELPAGLAEGFDGLVEAARSQGGVGALGHELGAEQAVGREALGGAAADERFVLSAVALLHGAGDRGADGLLGS